MIDLDERLKELDSIPATDLWREVRARASVPELRPVPRGPAAFPRAAERRWVAAVVAFAVFAAAGALVISRLRFGESTAPVSAPVAIAQAEQNFARLSTFRASVTFDHGTPEQRASASFEISYRFAGYREVLTAEEPDDLGSGTVGDVSVSDGRAGNYLGRSEAPLPEGFVSARDLSPAAGPASTAPTMTWSEICATSSSSVLADDEVAGRTSWHLRCGPRDASAPDGAFEELLVRLAADLGGEPRWDLWIDAETGVLLRVDGPMLPESEFRPLGCACTSDGFDVTSFEPGVTFDPPIFQVGSGRVDDPAGVSNELVFDPIAVQPPGVFDGATIYRVQTWAGGFLAFGSVNGEPGLWFWLSGDGVVWERVRPEPFGEEASPFTNGIAAGSWGLVALIIEGEDSSLWTSRDARTWERVPENPDAFPATSRLQDVETGGPGLVAIGCDPCDEDFTQAVWTSTDGRTWTQVEGIAQQFGERSLILMYRSASLVIGQEDNPEAAGAAAVWTTADGVSWTRLRLQPDLPDNGGNGLPVVGGPGFIVAGADGEFDDPAVWTSPNGETWAKVPYDASVFELDGLQPYPFVASIDSRVVMTSTDDWGAVVWTSTDGIDWTRLAYDPVAFGPGSTVTEVLAGESGTIAIGTRRVNDGPQSVVVWRVRAID